MLKKLKLIKNNPDKKQLINNYIALSFLQGANFIIPLILFPYLVRILGTETFGLLMFAQSFISYFNVLVDFGFSLFGVREVAIHRDNHQRLEEIFNSIMIIKIFLTLFSFFIMMGIVFGFAKFACSYKLYVFTFGLVVGQAMFPVWFFQGMEKMKYITIFQIAAQLLSLLAIIIFVKKPADYLLVPLFNSIGFILVGTVSIVTIVKKFQFKLSPPQLKTLKDYLLKSSHFFLSRVAVSTYTSSNTFVLGLFTNNTLVGYYAIAEKLYKALRALYMPIVSVLYPYVSKERDIRLFKKIFKLCISFNIITIITLSLMAPYLVKLVSGNMIPESTNVFRIFLLVAIIIVPSILVGYPFLAALGYKHYANYSVLGAALFHLSGLTILASLQKVSIYSVAILLIFTQIVDFSVRFYGVKKHHLWKLG